MLRLLNYVYYSAFLLLLLLTVILLLLLLILLKEPTTLNKYTIYTFVTEYQAEWNARTSGGSAHTSWLLLLPQEEEYFQRMKL